MMHFAATHIVPLPAEADRLIQLTMMRHGVVEVVRMVVIKPYVYSPYIISYYKGA